MKISAPRVLKVVSAIVVASSLALNLLVFLILFSPLNEILHEKMLVETPLVKGDVIVVCSSNFPFNTENGLLDLSTLVRLEKGLRLYRQGYADKIIAFGGIWMQRANKTTAMAIKERLLLAGVPEQDIIVQDQIKGKLYYYENLLDMMERYKGRFDFNKAIFVTSMDQSYRLYHCLLSEIKEPVVVTGEKYELAVDWGRRLHSFRRIANEILFGIPYFEHTGRFAVPSTFEWKSRSPTKLEQTRELYQEVFN